MADTKISALSAASTLDGTEPFPAVQGGSTVKVTGAQIATYTASVNISDTAYDATSWNGVTGVAPSKNAVRDQIETMVALQASDTAFATSWDGVTTIPPSKNAVYDAFLKMQHPGYVASNWYVPDYAGVSIASGGPATANRIYYTPFYLARPVTMSDLGARVSNNTAGNFKLGIYAADATTKLPSGNVLAATGDMSGASATLVTADISGANVLFDGPALYWGAFWADAAIGVYAISAGVSISPSAWLVGEATAGNLVSGGDWGNSYYSDETYGTWPNASSESLTSYLGLRRYVFIFKAA